MTQTTTNQQLTKSGKVWNWVEWIGELARMAIYIRDGFTCIYCGDDLMGESFNRSLDHVVARVDGGSHEASNLVTCCRSCNSSKQDTPLAVWKPEAIAAVEAAVALPVDVEGARRFINARRAAKRRAKKAAQA